MSPATMSPATTPALYDAVVTHVRRSPLANRFRYRTYYWLIDVDDPPRLPPGLRWLARFDPADRVDVRGFLRVHGIDADRIVMLAHARVAGYVFNPISVYWCYAADGAVAAVVAEVHNTYGGRHAYLLELDGHGRADIAKAMYVSPFYPVDGRYDIRVGEPTDTLTVAVTLHRDGDRPFAASLVGTRSPATIRALLRASIRVPLAPLRTSALIRWQGIRLRLRKLEVHPR